ncbi:MAG: DUF4340 domain-containing protein [Clostridia bacterium]|nr:DUF4340 domain-containing protein [Clostridia bacterium]
MKQEELIINLIFDAGKGTSPVQSREAVSGQAIGDLPIPERAGFAFDGWYLGEERVSAETLLSAEEDVRLEARWSKKQGTKRTSVLKKQRIAIVCLAVLIVLLAVATVIVNDILSVTAIEDVYYTEDGTRHAKTYYIKKVGDVWGMYDDDDKMPVNTDGYHIAISGNQYSIDQETGKCKLYAMVDSYDADIGELLGFDARVMMYPQITQSDIYSIVVKNQSETFEVVRHANGIAYLKGREGRINILDANAFANLATACGYTLTIEKLNLKSVDAPKNEDGSINYASYGLSDADNPIVFTITKRAFDEEGNSCAATGEGSSYTVRVGNVTLTGAGYYAKLEGRDSVYIMSPTVAPTLVKSIEAMVTPTVIHPMTATTYLMVKDFLLEKGNVSLGNAYSFLKGGDFTAAHQEAIVDFSYWDLFDREHSFYATHPYTTNSDIKSGYFLDSDSIFSVLASLHQMSDISCVKLGVTEEAIKEYLFNGGERGDVHHISFRYNLLERNEILTKQNYESTEEFHERILEEAKTILRQYTESDLEKLTFELARDTLESMGYYLENGVFYDKASHLYDVYTFLAGVLMDLGYSVEKINESAMLETGDLEAKVEALAKRVDATQTGYHYDRESGDVYIVNEILISERIDGKYYVASSHYDMIVEVDQRHFAFLEWNEKKWYSDRFNTVEIAYMTDLEIVAGNKNYKFRLDNSESNSTIENGQASDKLKVYANTGSGEKLLDYIINRPYTTDTGMQKTETIPALENFRNYYKILQYMSLEGYMDEKELEKLAAADFTGDGVADGYTPADCRALPDEACDLIIYFRAVDLRGNSMAKICRFYTYSGHSYLTIETVSAYDQNGAATTDWRALTEEGRAYGMFFVDASNLQSFVTDTERVINGSVNDIIVSPDMAPKS